MGHHQSHAANAFFTSNFDEALILTIDGGGIDNENGELHSKSSIDVIGHGSIVTSMTFWYGKDNKIDFVSSIPRCSPYELVGDQPFSKQSQANVFDRIFSQIIMIFNHFGSEGGLFIFTGKKK